MLSFMRKNFLLNLKIVGGKEVRENVLSQPSSSTPHSQNQENLEIELRRSKRARVEKDFVVIEVGSMNLLS